MGFFSFIFFLLLLFLIGVLIFGLSAVKMFFGSIFPSRKSSQRDDRGEKRENPFQREDDPDDNDIVVKTDLDEVPDVEYEKIEGE